jgi:hypothetical protein
MNYITRRDFLNYTWQEVFNGMIYATSGFELAARVCSKDDTAKEGRGRTVIMFDP